MGENSEFIPQVTNYANPRLTWSTTKLSMMLYKETSLLPAHDRAFWEFLFEKCPEIKKMEQMVKKFKNLFLNKSEGTLRCWINEASKEDLWQASAQIRVKTIAAFNIVFFIKME